RHRPDDQLPPRAEARLRRPVHRQEGRQAEPSLGEGQGRHGRAVDGRRAEQRDQRRELDSVAHRHEITAGRWPIGYTGQSPERLQAHMRNMHVFDVKTLRAKGGKDAKTGYVLDGDYYGLRWPCYGTPEMRHPGSPNLYQTSRHVMDGGGNFRANFGVEREGVSLLAEDTL